jgi:hypothetical protein
MGSAYFDFWEKEWPVIRDAPHLFFGGIIATGLIVWLFVRWIHKEQFATRDQRVAFAQERAQAAEQKGKDLQSEIEKLAAQLNANASPEDIAATMSSAKTKATELVGDIANFRGTVE